MLTSSSNILLGLAALNSTAKLTKQLKQAKDDNSGHTTPISKGDLELARSKQFDANHKLVPTGNLSEVPMLVAAAKAGVLASDIQTRFRPLSYKTDEAGTVEVRGDQITRTHITTFRCRTITSASEASVACRLLPAACVSPSAFFC